MYPLQTTNVILYQKQHSFLHEQQYQLRFHQKVPLKIERQTFSLILIHCTLPCYKLYRSYIYAHVWSIAKLWHTLNNNLSHPYLESIGLALGYLVLGDAAVEHVPGELIGVLPVIDQTNNTSTNWKHTVQARGSTTAIEQ